MSTTLPSVGTTFESREAMAKAGVHKHYMAGIDYEPDGNAIAIVLNGGYKDDEDYGDRVIYTGQGGQSKSGPKKQVTDQELIRGNGALVNSHLNASPVGIFRGAGGERKYSPEKGYRYDGLYQVIKHWFEPSQDGPLVIRFELVKIIEETLENEEIVIPILNGAPVGNSNPNRTLAKTGNRIKRDPAVPRWLKRLYLDRCQICGTTVRTPTGNYSQGAHIQGLGDPYNGSDTVSNMLCLCPNCHVMFDFGTYYIKDDCQTVVNALNGEELALYVLEPHSIDLASVAYHRLHVAGIHKG